MTTVVVERHGARLDIVLNRPQRKNAVTNELAGMLRDAFIEANLDTSIGCVLLRGAGDAFCSGMDLAEAGANLANEPLNNWLSVHQSIYRLRVPLVVALQRFAINAGASLVFAANICVAGESSFVQVSEIEMGVPAPMCQAWLHLRHSPAVGDRITLLGDRIAARECLRLGVVSEVVADDQVVSRAIEIADAIAGHPQSGLDGVMKVWRMLRNDIGDSDAWFANILSTGK